ncbi:MAG: MotA/TolQ/ExbB proton channel family protein, partial [Desulfobacterales bacterium]
MKLRRLLIISIILCLLPAAPVWGAQDWEQIAADIMQDNQATEKEAKYTLELIRKNKSDLQQELSETNEARKSRAAELKTLKAEFNGLLDTKNGLEKEIESEKEEIKAVSDTVYNAAQRNLALIENSPVTAEYPDRKEHLNPLLSKQRFPGMAGIQSLVDMIWDEMDASGDIRLYEGEFIGPDYQQQTGDILRVGSLTAAYRNPGGHIGYLELGEKNRLVAVPGDPSWFVKKSLEAYMKGKTNHMPLDVSGGSVFKRMAESRDFQDWLEAGGLLIWPILIVGAVGLLLALERFLFLFRIRSNSDKIMNQIMGFIQKESWSEAKTYCEKNKRFPTCNVLGTMFSHLGVTREAM